MINLPKNCLRIQHWTTMDNNGQQSTVLHASLMPYVYLLLLLNIKCAPPVKKLNVKPVLINWRLICLTLLLLLLHTKLVGKTTRGCCVLHNVQESAAVHCTVQICAVLHFYKAEPFCSSSQKCSRIQFQCIL